MKTTRTALTLVLANVVGCQLGNKSVGNEIQMTGFGSGGSAATSETTAEGDSPGRTSGDESTSGVEHWTTDEGPAPVGPDCDLGDYMTWIGRGNWTCGYTPYNEDLLQTHECILGFDDSLAALWTRPEEPSAEAVYIDRSVTPEVVTWYEHDSGTIRTWTCSGLSESPGCNVTALEMCLICAQPSTPEIVCSPP